MRFVSLSVESFRAIKRAQIAFGPGLNVLYGPNDLGKSTLATAIQAALLVMPSSSEGESYTPWFADLTPRVTLTFLDDKGFYWRVKKAFRGEETAELSGSKDGTNFKPDCKGREVDGKLREILAWGIPAPGGKGAPRGLPVSFLSQALLAPQTDVDGILGQTLADDTAMSGKLRLNAALATLAQDPLFKKVLDAAQAEFVKNFTATGRIKKPSPVWTASEEIKKLQAEQALVSQQLQASSLVEAEVNAKREQHTQALAALAEAKAALAEVQRRLELARARQAAQEKVDAAQAEVAKLDAHAARVAALEADLRALEGSVTKATESLQAAQEKRTTSEAALRKAEEAHRAATSEDGARQRALQRAQLEKKALELRAALQAAEARKEKISAAIAAAEAADKAQAATRAAAAEVTKSQKALAAAQQKLEGAAAEVELARAIHAYGRWRVASTQAAEAGKAGALAAAKRVEAAAKEAQAAALEAAQREEQERLERRQELLPPAVEARALAELDHALAVAEAALGGGLSVSVRTRGQMVVCAEIDGKAEGSRDELPPHASLEAQRTVKLAVGKNVEIDVTAGSPEKRRAVEALRERWSVQGAPALERAGAATMAELTKAVAAHAVEQQALATQAQAVDKLHAEAANLREQALRFDDQVSRAGADPAELLRMKELIGDTQEAILAAAFDKLGKNWEAQAEALRSSTAKKHEAAKAEASAAEQASKLADYKKGEADKAHKAQAELAKALAALLGTGEPRSLLQAVQAECAQLLAQEREAKEALQAQAQGATGEVARAQKGLEAAAAALAAAGAAVDEAGQALDAARALFHGRAGEVAQAKEHLAALDRAGAEQELQQRKAELAAVPAAAPASAGDLAAAAQVVAEAERALDRVKQELHTSEGALSKVGGAALAEEAARMEEALKAARQREAELSVDAAAWRLLQETLRAVENEEGAHLGRALAQPLERRFRELTGGRYEGLRMGPGLETEGVAVAGANTGEEDVVGALSVGTRDQLATLVRLTIAQQLKTAIVLDDHLVHTDAVRLKWFVEAFLKTALESQVVVLTCKAGDYLEAGDLEGGEAVRDVAGGRVRVVDVGRVVERWGAQDASAPGSA
jgi:hypothetical protein